MLSPFLVVFSPLYILLLLPQLRITRCHKLLVIPVALPVCTFEREREEDKFIRTKCEHLTNTQW